MSDYLKVTEALKAGAEPAMMCATCPWDRFCLTPPSMTSEEVQSHIDKASEKDRIAREEAEAKGDKSGFPAGMLITSLAFAGRDTQASICPVLALRLRSGEGEQIVHLIKKQMRTWDDDQVGS